jgi:hypothetical protein
MLRLTRVQFRKAENRSPVDGTRCARFGRLVSRLVDVAAIRFVSVALASLGKHSEDNLNRLKQSA